MEDFLKNLSLTNGGRGANCDYIEWQNMFELIKKLFKTRNRYVSDDHKEVVYQKGGVYITMEKTGYKGGFWKVYTKNGRVGLFNKDLSQKVSP